MNFGRFVVAAAASLLSPVCALAQAYPSQPIKIIVPQPPGAGSDLVGRFIGERLAARMNQPVIVENRGGAGGLIAAEAAAKAAPDGHTLFTCTSSAMITLPLVNPKAQYDPLKDFTPIIMLGRADNIVVVPANSPFRTLEDLIAYAKSNPGKLSYGSGGVGTTNHLAGELLAQQSGIDIVHVPYKGAPLAEADLITGRIDFMLNNTAPAMSNIRSGKSRAIAVAGAKRSPDLPHTPTAAEAGLRDFEVYGFIALCGPAKLPKPIVERLNMEVNRALDLPEVRSQLIKFGLEPAGGSPEELARFVGAELARWGRLIKDKKLKFD